MLTAVAVLPALGVGVHALVAAPNYKKVGPERRWIDLKYVDNRKRR